MTRAVRYLRSTKPHSGGWRIQCPYRTTTTQIFPNNCTVATIQLSQCYVAHLRRRSFVFENWMHPPSRAPPLLAIAMKPIDCNQLPLWQFGRGREVLRYFGRPYLYDSVPKAGKLVSACGGRAIDVRTAAYAPIPWANDGAREAREALAVLADAQDSAKQQQIVLAFVQRDSDDVLLALTVDVREFASQPLIRLEYREETLLKQLPLQIRIGVSSSAYAIIKRTLYLNSSGLLTQGKNRTSFVTSTQFRSHLPVLAPPQVVRRMAEFVSPITGVCVVCKQNCDTACEGCGRLLLCGSECSDRYQAHHQWWC